MTRTGVYKYVGYPHLEILLFSYSVDGGDIKVIDIATCEKIPEEILSALTDESVLKWAFNASLSVSVFPAISDIRSEDILTHLPGDA